VERTQPAAKKALGNFATDVRDKATGTLSKQPLPAIGDFGEAADSIREQSKPVFEKLDQLSGGDFKKAQDLERLARGGTNPDWAKVAEARSQQNQIFAKFKGEFAGDELKQAKANWRQSALDSVHESLDKAVYLPRQSGYMTTASLSAHQSSSPNCRFPETRRSKLALA
jgi:hypothetical protein